MLKNDIVVVKDGPVPQCIQNVIDEFQKNHDEIHPLQLEKNMGLGFALNAGLQVCRNDIVARMDSDDIHKYNPRRNPFNHPTVMYKKVKRKSWVNTKLLIQIRKNAWKSGYCSFFDFIYVSCAQLAVFLMPKRFQMFLYKNFLRK